MTTFCIDTRFQSHRPPCSAEIQSMSQQAAATLPYRYLVYTRSSAWIPRSVFGGLYRCAKFGWNRHYSFEGMRFSMLCEFGLKYLFTYFRGKMGRNGNFLQLYPSDNATTWD